MTTDMNGWPGLQVTPHTVECIQVMIMRMTYSKRVQKSGKPLKLKDGLESGGTQRATTCKRCVMCDLISGKSCTTEEKE